MHSLVSIYWFLYIRQHRNQTNNSLPHWYKHCINLFDSQRSYATCFRSHGAIIRQCYNISYNHIIFTCNYNGSILQKSCIFFKWFKKWVVICIVSCTDLFFYIRLCIFWSTKFSKYILLQFIFAFQFNGLNFVLICLCMLSAWLAVIIFRECILLFINIFHYISVYQLTFTFVSTEII
jgi:hypothetical protein